MQCSCRPCSRRSPTRRSTIRSSSTNPNTTASARSSEVAPRAGRRRAAVVAARQREDAPVSRDCSGAATVGARRRSRWCSTARSSRSTRKGSPTGFQQLQGRIHLAEADEQLPAVAHASPSSRSTSCATGGTDLRDRPLLERRAALERVFGDTGSPLLRISEMVRGDGRALYRARARPGMGRADRQARRVALQVAASARPTGAS